MASLLTGWQEQGLLLSVIGTICLLCFFFVDYMACYGLFYYFVLLLITYSHVISLTTSVHGDSKSLVKIPNEAHLGQDFHRSHHVLLYIQNEIAGMSKVGWLLNRLGKQNQLATAGSSTSLQ